MTLRVFFFAAALLATTATAEAHFHITSHASRHGGGDDVIKGGPCGVAGSARGEAVHTVEAGSTLMLVFEETIEHPGWYRIALDLDGDDDFVDPAAIDDYETNGMFPDGPILVTNIPDQPDATQANPNIYMQAVEIPAGISCTNCTLQAIQVMTENFGTNQDIYYDCLDLTIIDPATGEMPDAGSIDNGDAGGQEPGGAGAPSVSGGCSSAGSDSGPLAALLLFGLLALFRSRIRQRRSLGR